MTAREQGLPAADPHEISAPHSGIVVLAPTAVAGQAHRLAASPAYRFHDIQAFRAARVTPSAFVVHSDDSDYAAKCLRDIRRDPLWATSLVFTAGAITAADATLSDGSIPDSTEALKRKIEEFETRRDAIVSADADSPDALLLRYLWLRPQGLLEPQADWRRPRRYGYPILEALDRTEADPETWIQQLDKSGHIERVQLKDRQRECDYCGSAHLSFVDVCPSCRGIDIDRHTALHCFTCGLIAPEQRFINGDQRLCPKCGTRLRHIGSDYDRPMETYCCQGCDHVFIEGVVLARCAICQHSMPPDNLRLHKVYSWRLSAHGKLAAQGRSPMRSGGSSADGAHNSKTVGLDRFVSNLDWMLRIVGERPGLSFGLVGLHLENHAELESQLGAGRTAALADAFCERLGELLSDVDQSARASADVIYLLLPNSDAAKISSLLKSVAELSAQSEQPEGSALQWRRADLVIDRQLARGQSAEALLRKLLSASAPVRAPARASRLARLANSWRR